jgi:hypothetical protein
MTEAWSPQLGKAGVLVEHSLVEPARVGRRVEVCGLLYPYGPETAWFICRVEGEELAPGGDWPCFPAAAIGPVIESAPAGPTDQQRLMVCRELVAYQFKNGQTHMDQALYAYEREAKARLGL